MVADTISKPFNITYVRINEAYAVGQPTAKINITGDLSASDPVVVNVDLMKGTENNLVPEIDPRLNCAIFSTANQN